MGTIINKSIIVSSWGVKNLEGAHLMARKLGLPCSGIVIHAINGGGTFIIAPDGSKLGWNTHEAHEALRREFLNWAATQRHEDDSSDLYIVYIEHGECAPSILHLPQPPKEK